MFKPLLRTIPSLSGNVMIGCKVDRVQRSNKNKSMYVAAIQSAALYPTQNSVFTKKLNLNLATGKWEHDVRRFYHVFSDSFYKDNYIFNKKDYKLLDLFSASDPQDSRNKDYEFGCRRISYSELGYQMQFYAPIYIDNSDDLPDYFDIDIMLSANIKKTIRIMINHEDKLNYLRAYLHHYIDKINDDVVYCLHDSNQATYFGIDALNGGLVQIKDDVIGTIYNKQTTINNFDYMICNGFARNHLMMSQVIPLCFMFNISDVISRRERSKFYASPVRVRGHYIKNNIKYKMYDFDIDYTNYYPEYKYYQPSTGQFLWNVGHTTINESMSPMCNLDKPYEIDTNVMDIGYPSLRESKYYKYKYTNKITPMYSKWKLKLSSDEHPYITNMSWAYSALYTNNYKYGTFPTTFKDILPELYIHTNDDSTSNVVLPIGNNLDLYYTDETYVPQTTDDIRYNNDALKYNKLIGNYISEWYNMFTNLSSMMKNRNIWSRVSNRTSYYNGILYNFSSCTSDIDFNKFGVFMRVVFHEIDYAKMADIHLGNVVLSQSVASGYKIPQVSGLSTDITDGEITVPQDLYNLNNTLTSGTTYAHYDMLMIRDDEGKYVEASDFYNRNIYYKYDKVYAIIYDILTNGDYSSTERDINTFFDTLKRHRAGYIEGHPEININNCTERIAVVNNNNMFWDYYDKIVGAVKHMFMMSEYVYSEENINSQNSATEHNDFYWLCDKMYVTTNNSTEKKNVRSLYNTVSMSEDTEGKMSLFLKYDFISRYQLMYALTNTCRNIKYINQDICNSEFVERVMQAVQSLQTYNYVPYSTDNDITNTGYFVRSDHKIFANTITSDKLSDDTYTRDIIYVDTYNLKNYIQIYIDSKQEMLRITQLQDPGNTTLINALEHIIGVAQQELENINKLENINNNNNNKYKQLHEKYCQFVNRNHIKEYIRNLSTGIAQGETELTPDKNDKARFYMNNIYARFRIFVNDTTHQTIINNTSRNDNELQVRDIYVPLSELIIFDDYDLIDDFINHISETHDAVNGTKFTINIDRYKISDKIYDELDCSDYVYATTAQNKGYAVQSTIQLELCFKKNFIYLTHGLKEMITYLNDYDGNSFSYMYLYRANDNVDTSYDMMPMFVLKNDGKYYKPYKTDENETKIQEITTLDTCEICDIYACLTPLFTHDIYVNEDDSRILKQMLHTNKISEIKVINNKNISPDNENTPADNENISVDNENISDDNENISDDNEKIPDYIYIYSDNTVPCFVELTDEEFKTIGDDVQRYSVYMNNSIEVSRYNDLYNDELCKDIEFDEPSGLNIHRDGYAFYIITVDVDNSSNTFKIKNDENVRYIFDYINNVLVSQQYISSIFKKIHPFMKSEPFSDYIKKVKTIVFPTAFNINLNYVPIIYDNGYTEDSEKYRSYYNDETEDVQDPLLHIDYDKKTGMKLDPARVDKRIYDIKFINKRIRKIKLLRYFNYITPIISERENIQDCYGLKYKSYNGEINENNIYRRTENIYEYSGLYVKHKDNTVSQNIFAYEYKHFNDNKIFVMPTEISIHVNELLTYNELLEYEKDDVILKYFTNELNKYEYKKHEQNEALFLFNKYKVNCMSMPVKLNRSHTEKLYKLTYKFTLI